ncbi:hypothetical protein R69749_06832 [Paraburkholderia domus]|nr:hypothetical protein R70006_06634 [Paraburkholderia domus]CAE6847310.1 hypothetical protein R70199_00161 [Paraburkholderia domus]CAE6877763.1 hypothetical protein R69749_06832 [Paraburkholderia domus]CAE6890930.1 hypothetical protein R75471_02378 [Paraburkholderia domus]
MIFLWRACAARFPAGRCVTRCPRCFTFARGRSAPSCRYPGCQHINPAFPRVTRSGTLACSASSTQSGSTCMTNAVAYRCGGNAGSRVQANGTPCLTFNRGLTAVQLRALSIDKRARAPKSGQFRSGLRVRQEWLIHAQTVLLSAGYCPMRELFFIIWSIKACTKRCCYVSKRDNCRNLRHSALKCDVFRGRSRCSPNSKHFHRISAS